MVLQLFTLFHVAIRLVGILAGAIIAVRMLTNRPLAGWNTIFLITNILTSVTGSLFPVKHFMPSHGVGILSLLVLVLALYAFYSRRLQGAWGKTYAITAKIALYFNVFVATVRSFEKIHSLKALDPTQQKAPFKLARGVVLIAFFVIGTLAALRFRQTRLPTLGVA